MGLLGSFVAVQGFKVEGGKQAGTDKVRQIMKRETSAAVKIKKRREKYAPLSLGILAASYTLVLEERRGKEE